MGKSGKVSITAKPSKKVGIKKPTRDDNKFTVKWSTPKDALSEKKKDRFEEIWVRWRALTYSGELSGSKEKQTDAFVEHFTEGDFTKTKKGRIAYWQIVNKSKYFVALFKRVASSNLKTKMLDSNNKHKKETDTSDSYSISRSKYYPKTSTRLLEVWAEASGENKISKKKNSHSWAVSDGYIFDNPRVPVFSGMSLNMETGTLSATVTSDPGKDDRERYWTKTWITRERSDGKKSTPKKKPSEGSTKTTNSLSYDELEWNTWPSGSNKFDRWIKVIFHAQDSGFAGDSKEAQVSHIFAYPAMATFGTYKDAKGKDLGPIKRVVSQTSGSDPLGVTTVKINTHSSTYRPVDAVEWQVLKDQPVSMTAAQASASDGWMVLAEDDKDTLGLSVSTDLLVSAVDTYSWMRLVTYHDELYLQTEPIRLNDAPYHTESSTAANDKCAILDCISTAEGTGLKVTLGWDSKNSQSDDDNTGVEVSWSTNPDAWRSTEQPSTFNVDWIDSKPSEGNWVNKSIVTIQNLEQSTQYYIKARVYQESEERGTTYGVYTDKIEGTNDKLVMAPSSTPLSATLVAPDFIKEGSDFDVYWTYSSEAFQTAWEILNVVYTANVAGPGTKPFANSTSESDGSGAANIKWETIEPYLNDDKVEMILRLTTGGGWVYSNVETVTIAKQPEIALVNVPQTFSSQPISFQLKSTDTEVELHAVITAEGKKQPTPEGELAQSDGDIVWSNIFSDREWNNIDNTYIVKDIVPANSILPYITSNRVIDGDNFTVFITTSSEEAEQDLYSTDDTSNWARDSLRGNIIRRNDSYNSEEDEVFYIKATFTYPNDIVYSSTQFDVPVQDYFFDEADYKLTVIAINKTTRMVSESATAKFTTKWEHQPNPAGKGTHAVGFTSESVRGCKIYTVSPEGALETDSCEIYRVTPDGVYQIATNVKFGAIVTDRFAPFSKYANLRYLVVTRTADRDWTGVEIPYNVTETLMRFDWNGRFVELPYNNKMSDSFAKDVEVRKHLNGDRMAAWNKGYDRTASLSTDIIKIAEIEKQEAVRALGEYAGPVFVRTPDGCAYEADVQVNGLDWEYNNPIMPVSFTATEIKLSDEFKCDPAKDVTEVVESLEPEEPTGETGA